MTTISDKTKNLIKYSVDLAKLVNIEKVLIEKTGIRGKQEESAIYIIDNTDCSFIEFDYLYITRCQTLSQRLAMFERGKKEYEISIDTKENDAGDVKVKQLNLASSKTKVEFNCGDPDIIVKSKTNALPKKINDPLTYAFEMTAETYDMLNRAVSAMKTKNIRIIGETKDGGVTCKILDIEGDTLTHELSDYYDFVDNDDTTEEFSFDYDYKSLMPLFREALKEEDSLIIGITKRGILELKIMDIKIYIFPEG